MGNLKKMTVCGMTEIKNKSIDDLKNRYLKQLYDGILALHQEDPSIQGLVNYNRYNTRFGKEIQLSKDSIVFSVLMTDIKDKIKKMAELFKLDYMSPNSEDESVVPAEGDEPIMSGDEMAEFFGKGEFPFLVFRVFKIGEVQYSAYTITR